jgi:toxin ParE1/3/4
MANYRLVDDATDDLNQIADYYSDKSPDYCDKLLAKLTRQFEMLVVIPKMGRARDELLPGMRFVVVQPYSIFYRVVGDDIEILRVIHGRRNITPRMFLPFE